MLLESRPTRKAAGRTLDDRLHTRWARQMPMMGGGDSHALDAGLSREQQDRALTIISSHDRAMALKDWVAGGIGAIMDDDAHFIIRIGSRRISPEILKKGLAGCVAILRP
jgi:hypothetical protein